MKQIQLLIILILSNNLLLAQANGTDKNFRIISDFEKNRGVLQSDTFDLYDHSTDLEALYISKIDGTDFRKLTRELHEFYDWNMIKGDNRIYYRTLEDQNKDGNLNNKDKFHYYYIVFTGDSYSVAEYNPVKIFE